MPDDQKLQDAIDAAEAQDWRLRVDLESGDRHALDGIFGSTRARKIRDEEDSKRVPREVVFSHDGATMFAYAASKEHLDRARAAIEAGVRRHAAQAKLTVSRFDHKLDDWLQVDPPLQGVDLQDQQVKEQDAERIETRTIASTEGRVVRADVESAMRNYAKELGIECTLVEHPHLLDEQVVFTITGPARKLDEFRSGLDAEFRLSMRVDTAMLSPIGSLLHLL